MPHFPPFLAQGLAGVGWMLIDKAALWEMGLVRGPGASPGSWEWGPPVYTGGPAREQAVCGRRVKAPLLT